MASLKEIFRSVYRDFAAEGVPASGAHEPAKPEIRAIGEALDAKIAAASIGDPDLIEDLMQPYVDDAQAGASSSQTWAEGTTPDGPGTYSAKELSEQAAEHAEAAAESAIEVGNLIFQEGSEADDYVWRFVDADGRIVIKQTTNGEVFVPGLEGKSIQEAIGGSAAKDTSLAAQRGYRAILADDASAVAVTRMQAQTGLAAPCPIDLQPQAFSITTDILDSFTVAQPADRLHIDSPYFPDDQFVHPHLVEFYNGFCGFRYWMAINPYRNSNNVYENPVIYGTDDFLTFTPIPGAPWPLTGNPGDGYLADNGFGYNPMTGELMVFWIRFRNSTQTTEGQFKTSKDGVNWSGIQQLFPPTLLSDESMVSPQPIFNPKTRMWHLYTQAVTGANLNVARKLRVRMCRVLGDAWSAPIEIATPDAVRPWHFDIRYVGGRFYILCANTYIGNLFLGSSDDGIAFAFGTTPILTDNDPSYKASFVPIFEGDTMALRLLWTTDGDSPLNTAPKWQVYTAITNFVPIEEAS